MPSNMTRKTKIYTPNKDQNLELLRSILGLHPNTSPWDVILVSFDMETKHNNKRLNSYNIINEIGISTFDTRSLHPPIPSASLRTRHLVCGGSIRLRRCANEYHFGVSEQIDDSKINETVKQMLQIPDELVHSFTGGRFRKVVIVGHGLGHDLSILRRRGIKLQKLGTVIAIIDTEDLAREMLGMGMELVSLLRILGIPYEGVHNAGNDANFTLRALLMLASYGSCSGVCTEERFGMLEFIKGLAEEELPDTTERNAGWREERMMARDFGDDLLQDDLDLGLLMFGED